MKRTIIISGIVVGVTLIALILFNRLLSKKDDSGIYAEAVQGKFEISVAATGELVAEESDDILAPDMMLANKRIRGVRGRGGNIRLSPLKILDMVPEGTIVKRGDYIAQLDRTDYDNTLKDDQENLSTREADMNLTLLDSAVVLSSLRDDIRNQKFTLSESEITLRNSKYEAPDIIRQAEIEVEKNKRLLEQKQRSYRLKEAQIMQDIRNNQYYISTIKSRIKILGELLSEFTITSPSDGMVIYKKDLRGIKRKVGTMISPFDRAVATIPDLSTMTSKTYINEIDVNKIKPGQKVEIKVDAFPDRSFTGKILSVANIGEVLPNSDSKVFETMISLDDRDPSLKPSMTTNNKVIVASINDVVYIPTECIHTDADNIPYVFTRNKLRQIVIPGVANEKNTIIKQGLNPGTVVYRGEPENFEKFKLVGQELISVLQHPDNPVKDIAELEK
jgi:multidrug efflux pump subunit AcrA (membrane-fusion protein)